MSILLSCDNCFKNLAGFGDERIITRIEEIAKDYGWDQVSFGGPYRDFCCEECVIDFRSNFESKERI